MAGGGKSHETYSQIPEEFVPPLAESITAAVESYRQGDLSKVAGLSEQQQAGFGDVLGATAGQADTALKSAAARDLLGQTAAGAEITPWHSQATQGLKSAAIHDARSAWAPTGRSIAAAGQVGSGRTAVAEGDRDAQLASQLAGIDYKDYDTRRANQLAAAGNVISAGSDIQSQYVTPGQTRAEVGSALQEQAQRELDAGYQGVQRLGALLTGTPIPQQGAVGKKGK